MLRKVSSVIAGVGKYVPDKVVTSRAIEERLALEQRFGLMKGIIENQTGVKERRHVSGEEVSSDMALRASQAALEQAGVRADELDLVIFASASHDVAEPATANILQDKLMARNAHVFDVKNACNSFLNALDIMDAFIQTGRCRIGLVAAGEVLSKCINWEIDTLEEFGLNFAALTLGDGGGAVVVMAGDEGEETKRGVLGSCFTSDGSMWELATIMGGGTRYPRDVSQMYFVSQSLNIAKAAIRNIPPVIGAALQQAGWRPEDVDLVAPHQVSRQIIKRISKISGIPYRKCMITLTKYGNTAASSIPIALAEAMESGRVHKGSKVLLVGGASGFSAGATALVL
jgi:3-oxoacyl-[acyl-carrier-protein] synthase-3